MSSHNLLPFRGTAIMMDSTGPARETACKSDKLFFFSRLGMKFRTGLVLEKLASCLLRS